MKQTSSGQRKAFPAIPITRPILRTLGFMTAGAMFLTVAGLLSASPDVTAFGIGAAISLLPNAYFAIRVLLVPSPLNAGLRLRQLYAAEVTKLLICALLFALVFTSWKALPPAWLLIGFVVTHLGYLAISARLLSRV